jgi:hypothetical protein
MVPDLRCQHDIRIKKSPPAKVNILQKIWIDIMTSISAVYSINLSFGQTGKMLARIFHEHFACIYTKTKLLNIIDFF